MEQNKKGTETMNNVERDFLLKRKETLTQTIKKEKDDLQKEFFKGALDELNWFLGNFSQRPILGDTVYIIIRNVYTNNLKVTCPTCKGKHFIRYNNRKMACSNCRSDGIVIRHLPQHSVRRCTYFKPDQVITEETEDNPYIRRDEETYGTKEDAQEVADKRNKEELKKMRTWFVEKFGVKEWDKIKEKLIK